MDKIESVSKPKMKFHNSMGRELQTFKPIEEGKVTLYTCGPTVYNYVHIGNLRTFVFEDILRRTLKHLGYDVTQVMNLTDIDDKTIKGSIETGLSLSEYTSKYKQAFFEDIDQLGIERVEYYPSATDYISEMITMIQTLVDKGFAYQGSDQSIYFSISTYPAYGTLSGIQLDELKENAADRIESDEYEKDQASDFVLWKAYDEERDGGIFWESPFGNGRPGWHIECSAMATNILGETIDIHTGGIDNLFPHHENEIAQSQCCSNKTFAHYWLHAEHLVVEGKKMSKSLGNFFTLGDLLEKGYAPPVIRYLLMQTHYKNSLNFTFEGLTAAKHSLERLWAVKDRLDSAAAVEIDSSQAIHQLTDFYKLFLQGLSEDLNMSKSLAAVFDATHFINKLLDGEGVSIEFLAEAKEFYSRIDEVLNVMEQKEEVSLDDHWEKKLQERELARKNKDFQTADQIRDELLAAGYLIEDSPEGPRLKAK